ncbi:hypothetical protein GCM10010300_25190 [Streptomyces olivaceoviridis]|uniref:cellulose-binding domain-containing protein n=1 Tax=Streptomyces olivaceoviridis TaxID=1921 RepID=UPI0019CD3F7E|nr:cellulose-binding domain-containing protein [Streptomyces olivaceoviridis]GGY80188.1 hypothetical protein GCM10010300_25190 [Streptomyces olivaceoviridis]
MSLPLARRRPVTALAVCAAALALTASAAAAPEPAGASPAAVLPYQDPSAPVPDRVTDLPARMPLDDKLGQMTQIEQDALVPRSDLAAYGSLTTGGGRATVRDAAFNGSLRPGGTTTFGFTAEGAPGTPAPHRAGS